MILSFAATMLFSLALAIWSRRGHDRPDAREFFTASGQFGPILFFFLSVGETYSIATMLGFPGGVYAGGESFVLWFFGYILMAGPAIYFVGPWIWRAGALYASATIPDFFRSHFNSRALEILIAASAIILLIPIGTTQFLGLRLVFGGLAPGVPTMVLTGMAGFLAFAYVALAGLRASAFVAVLKDILMMGSIVLVGGMAIAMSGRVHPVAPLAAPKAPDAANMTFAITTIVLQAAGFVMIPQNWAFIFSARSPRAIQRAQVVAPIYMLMFPLLMIVAYYAKAGGIVPHVPDYVFLATASTLLPRWLVGVVMAAVVLSGLVVLSSVCLAIGPLFARNLVPGLNSQAQQRWSRIIIALFIIFSLVAAEMSVPLIATLNNIFYFGIVQTLPGFVAAMLLPRVPARAVIAGIIAGDAFVLNARLTQVNLGGINPGLIGLCVNGAMMAMIAAAWPRIGHLSVMQQFVARRSHPEQASTSPTSPITQT